MRRWSALLVAGGLLSAAAVVAAVPASAAPSQLRAGGQLSVGDELVSADGRYHAAVGRYGRLAVRTTSGRWVWTTPATGVNATARLGTRGQLTLTVGGEVRWRTRTRGSGSDDVLTMRNDGTLAITAHGLLVWSSRAPNRCPALSGKTVVVDLSAQQARMCRHGQQLRTTAVTTGASALGYGTPTGTWHIYARVRNTTLYPAAGGAYPVRYWMPYSGPYGIHDSPWQNFPYGSSLYTTRGSHGCVHVPGAMMAWLFGWAPVGTRVTVHR